jgi:Flp pilus assembly pilin Flp
MRPSFSALTQRATWLRDDRGATAIEFALVALPFFMLVIGIIAIGLYFFTTNALEHGVEAASRKIRTGQAQNGELTVGQFKQLVCNEAGRYISCNKLHVLVQSGEQWSDLTPEACVSNNQMTESTGQSDDMIQEYSGGAKSVVLITVCYKWDLAELFRFMNFGVGTGEGPAILQASTAFRIEPYSST